MLRIILPIFLLATSAFAQTYDLSTLPKGFSFVSEDDISRVTVNYLGQQGDIYIFEEIFEYNDGTRGRVTLHANRESQTVMWEENGQRTDFSPHDCVPGLGACRYTWTNDEGAVEMKAFGKLVGDIFFSEEYFLDGETWRPWSRSCSTYGEYGFWIDFVHIYADGQRNYGARVRPGESRLDDLWALCDPPELIS